MSEAIIDSVDAAADEVEDLSAQNAIQNKYTFWFRGGVGDASKNQKINYNESIKKIATFQTVEQFWRIYDHLKRPNDFKVTTEYHLFKEGISPMWEDPQNKLGGKWLIRLKKGISSRYWEDIVMAVIGEQFDVGPEICGAVVSIRHSEDIISVWNKTADNEEAVNKIRDQMRKLLKLPTIIAIEYKKHQDCLVDKSSYHNPTVVWRAPSRFNNSQGGGGAHHERNSGSDGYGSGRQNAERGSYNGAGGSSGERNERGSYNKYQGASGGGHPSNREHFSAHNNHNQRDRDHHGGGGEFKPAWKSNERGGGDSSSLKHPGQSGGTGWSGTHREQRERGYNGNASSNQRDHPHHPPPPSNLSSAVSGGGGGWVRGVSVNKSAAQPLSTDSSSEKKTVNGSTGSSDSTKKPAENIWDKLKPQLMKE